MTGSAHQQAFYFSLFCLLVIAGCQRYEFKHSLRPPFYLGRGGSLPFWEFGGSTVVMEDSIRLTPAQQSTVGRIWNGVPVEMDSWEVHVDLQIGGGGKVGADGMGLWYTNEPHKEGPVMGNKDYFKGVGVIFDSFDNDGRNDNPSIVVLVNDGTKSFNAAQDGSELTVGACKQLTWRDKKTKVKISYQNEVFQVFVEYPYGENSWQPCVSHQIRLEKGYYFGATAATGHLFDNHDLYSWVTYNLDPWKQPPTATEQHADIQQRLDLLTDANTTPPPSSLPIGYDSVQTPPPIQQQQAQQPMPVHRPVQTPHQPVQQPVSQLTQQPMQAVQQPVQTSHQHAQPVQQSPGQEQDNWAGLKQLQAQMNALQQQQSQIIANVNQLTAELRSVSTSRSSSSSGQPQVFADALEKLLAVVSDTKTVMADDAQILRNNLLDIKHSLNMVSGGANRELLSAVSDIKQKLVTVQTAVETAKREQANIVADLQTNKEVLVSKIEEGSSFGFWTFFLFFQVCFGIAFFLWRKMRDDASKKFD